MWIVGPERRRHLRQSVPTRLAADPAHHLADEMAIGIGVVGVAGARFPPGLEWRPAPRSSAPNPTGPRWSAARRWPARRPGGTGHGAGWPIPCRRRRTRATPRQGDRPGGSPRRRPTAGRAMPGPACRPSSSPPGCRGSTAAERRASTKPPARSTTGTPSIRTQTAAPSSPRSEKFRMNSSSTERKRESQVPTTGVDTAAVCHCRRDGPGSAKDTRRGTDPDAPRRQPHVPKERRLPPRCLLHVDVDQKPVPAMMAPFSLVPVMPPELTASPNWKTAPLAAATQ